MNTKINTTNFFRGGSSESSQRPTSRISQERVFRLARKVKVLSNSREILRNKL